MSILNDDQVADLRDAFPSKKEVSASTLRKRAQRARERAAKEAAAGDTPEAFWKKNRAALPAETLQAMLAQHEHVHDLLAVMELAGEEVHLDFIPVVEVTADVVEFVKEHGVVHLSSFTKDGDIPPDWSSQPFWRNPEVMQKLTSENWQTAQYVKFGLLSGLPDWRVLAFLTNKAGWEWDRAAKLVGIVIDHGVARYQ